MTPSQDKSSFLAGFLLAANIVDAFATLAWIRLDIATEYNPFMADLVHNEPVTFMAVKSSMVSMGIFILWNRRGHRLADIGMALSVVAYAIVLVCHIVIGSSLING